MKDYGLGPLVEGEAWFKQNVPMTSSISMITWSYSLSSMSLESMMSTMTFNSNSTVKLIYNNYDKEKQIKKKVIMNVQLKTFSSILLFPFEVMNFFKLPQYS